MSSPSSPSSLPEEFKKAAATLFDKAEHREIFGLTFSENPEEWTAAHLNVLNKFYVANEKQLEPAKEQLLKTLKWRKEFEPLKATQEEFNEKLNRLGVVTKSPEGRVVTWNLYGAVKNPGEIFGELDTFLRWRVGLHERALALLDFSDEKFSVMDQVHDYMGVSFLRMDSNIRKASSKVIEFFQTYYPETLGGKYFVNVPYIMMWVFKLVRGLTSEATTAKFHVLANGDQLYTELGNWVPKSYGGKAKNLASISAGGEANKESAEKLKEADQADENGKGQSQQPSQQPSQSQNGAAVSTTTTTTAGGDNNVLAAAGTGAAGVGIAGVGVAGAEQQQSSTQTPPKGPLEGAGSPPTSTDPFVDAPAHLDASGAAARGVQA